MTTGYPLNGEIACARRGARRATRCGSFRCTCGGRCRARGPVDVLCDRLDAPDDQGPRLPAPDGRRLRAVRLPGIRGEPARPICGAGADPGGQRTAVARAGGGHQARTVAFIAGPPEAAPVAEGKDIGPGLAADATPVGVGGRTAPTGVGTWALSSQASVPARPAAVTGPPWLWLAAADGVYLTPRLIRWPIVVAIVLSAGEIAAAVACVPHLPTQPSYVLRVISLKITSQRRQIQIGGLRRCLRLQVAITSP